MDMLNSWDHGYKELDGFLKFSFLTLKGIYVCCRVFRKYRKDSFLLKDIFFKFF